MHCTLVCDSACVRACILCLCHRTHVCACMSSWELRAKTQKSSQIFDFDARSCVHVRMCACEFVHACVYACTSVCMQVFVRMHACMRACMYACMYVCVHVCMRACMYACMYVCARMCVYVHMLIFAHVCMCVHIFICKRVCVRALLNVQGARFICSHVSTSMVRLTRTGRKRIHMHVESHAL
jgi:hypothetical protein